MDHENGWRGGKGRHIGSIDWSSCPDPYPTAELSQYAKQRERMVCNLMLGKASLAENKIKPSKYFMVP